MKNILALIILLALPVTAQAGEPWTPREKALEGAYLALTIIDWGQSRYISDHPDRFYERNRWLPEHPTNKEVDRFFISSTALHLIVVNALNHQWRQPVQWLTILEKAYTVNRNHQIGIKIAF